MVNMFGNNITGMHALDNMFDYNINHDAVRGFSLGLRKQS